MNNQKSSVAVGMACHLDRHFLSAAVPLFNEEKVEVIEWSFDTHYNYRHIPDWFADLLLSYSQENRLVGHGVYFSMLSGKWLDEQENWLAELKAKCETFKFDHISEHFGFLTGTHFHQGAPLPVPYSSEVLAIGQDRLKRIYEACQCPVGIENLAFSFTLDQVKQQGEFLDKLVAPVNGFLILDLHNIYCQLHNFDLDFETLISLYPLDRVREIHLSGGSWEPSFTDSDQNIRRDTHDGGVPEAVFELLSQVVSHCPNLKYIMLEQLGRGLVSTSNKVQFQKDYNRLYNWAEEHLKMTSEFPNFFVPEAFNLENKPLENDMLFHQQMQLSDILENSTDLNDARLRLSRSTLSQTEWEIEHWHDDLLDTAIKIAQKWKTGFSTPKPV